MNINQQSTALFVVFLISQIYQVMNSPNQFCINRSKALPIFCAAYAFLVRFSNESNGIFVLVVVFSSDKFRFFNLPFLTDFFISFKRYCCSELQK